MSTDAPGPTAIGVDVGGSKAAAGVVTADGRVVASVRRATPADGAGTLAAIADLVTELAAVAPAAAVGVGVAGWVSADRSTVRFAPHLAWRDEPVRDQLSARLGRPVVVDNDANAAAWAEYRFGAGRGDPVLACLTLGTGIGGGLVLDGRLYRGRYGLAGEWGHVRVVPDGYPCPCGNRGCWEQYVSGRALGRAARELAARSPARAAVLLELVGGDRAALRGEHVTAAARAGDAAARELIAAAGSWLGQGVADLAASLDPGAVVVGGGLSELGDLLLDPARERYAEVLTGRGHRPELRLVAAELGPAAGLVGAADLARGGG